MMNLGIDPDEIEKKLPFTKHTLMKQHKLHLTINLLLILLIK